MEKIKFAVLVAYLVKTTGHTFDEWEMKQLDELIGNVNTQADGLNFLMTAIRDGRKIDAIKQYRIMTGAPLKDAKNAVEAHCNFPLPEWARQQAAID